MEILVKSRHDIAQFDSEVKWMLISAYDPTDSEGPARIKKQDTLQASLFLGFHDIDNEMMKGFLGKYPSSETRKALTLFSNEQAILLVRFVRQYMDKCELIVCQCDAGISRSSGMAAALSKCINGDDKFYFTNYIPNGWVYRKIIDMWNGGESVGMES